MLRRIDALAGRQTRVEVAQWYVYACSPPIRTGWGCQLLGIVERVQQAQIGIKDLLVQPLPTPQTPTRVCHPQTASQQ
jgi:hypothetical protein